MSVKELRKGVACKVVKVNPAHHASKKLIEMGIVPNCEISVENIAPMGDPYIIRVRGYNLAVRKKDLEALEFKMLNQKGDA